MGMKITSVTCLKCDKTMHCDGSVTDSVLKRKPVSANSIRDCRECVHMGDALYDITIPC